MTTSSVRGTRGVKLTRKHSKAIEDVIKHFGGRLVDVSKSIGVLPANVYAWRNNKTPIPLHHAEKIQKITDNKFTVLQMRPDIQKYAKYFQ